MIPVFFRSDVLFGFAHPFFAWPIGRAGRIGCHELNLSKPVLYINDFLTVQHQGAFQIRYQILLKLTRVRRKRNKKAWPWDKFFHFQIFESFGNLEIIEINQFFRCYPKFLLKLWQTMKQIWNMSLLKILWQVSI